MLSSISIRQLYLINRQWASFHKTAAALKSRTPQICRTLNVEDESSEIVTRDSQQIQKIDEEIERLRTQRAQLIASSSECKGQRRLILRTPIGTRDLGQAYNSQREKVLEKIKKIFKTHGAAELDTPAIELTDILTGRYGEEAKLIYNLQDHGSEQLSLRYDLTVPFARYLAMNKLTSLKRYQMGKVYRRDKPKPSRGRFREFYQCDFDIAGKSNGILADVECIKIIADIMDALEIGDYIIKVNHRQLLNGIFLKSGIPTSKFNTICPSIDKLDKTSWADVRAELVNEKGLSKESIDEIGSYVRLKGGSELISKLLDDAELNKRRNAAAALKDLADLYKACDILGIKGKVVVDTSLARGHDYYTGVIFECVLRDEPDLPHANEDGSDGDGDDNTIGAIAGGGRYDNLVSMFHPNNTQVPCVGLSIGVERIIAILNARNPILMDSPTGGDVDVFVISTNSNLWPQRLQILRKLWAHDIKATHALFTGIRYLDQVQNCEKNKIPLAITIGPSEMEKDIVLLRDVEAREDKAVRNAELIEVVKKRLKTIRQ